MRSYQKLLETDGALASAVLRDDGAIVPNDAGNRDWVEYLAWIAAGHVALPAAPIAKNIISVRDLLGRFTGPEQTALWTALSGRPQALGALLVHLADGAVDLTGPRVKALLDILVTAGVLTPERKTAILTP